MSKGIVLDREFCSNGLPINIAELAILNDGEKKVFVSLMVPLGRHLKVLVEEISQQSYQRGVSKYQRSDEMCTI
jgi:hypothetical protein